MAEQQIPIDIQANADRLYKEEGFDMRDDIADYHRKQGYIQGRLDERAANTIPYPTTVVE